MSAEFFLKTLGVPRLETAAGSEIRIRVRKHLAVLIVLAVENGKVRRDRLVGMLWPTSRPDRARGSLATAISFLRGKLGGDAIEPGRDFVELTPGLVGLDLERLEKGEIIGDDFTPLLEVDAFLNGFELESLPEFEAWRDRHHARLLPSIEKGLLGLTDHCRRSGDISGLARYADRMLQLNDLSEWGIKARMEAYALSGDRITALRVYDDWVERLKSELDAAPARLVEDLAHRLRRRSWDRPPSEPHTAPVRTEQWRDKIFVGRAREYRLLYSIWEEIKKHGSRHVLITGDSGVGKTTLADRFATAIALEGAGVARVRCFELERSIPYAMIVSALEALIDRPGVSATSPEALAELSCYLPEIRRRYPKLPTTPELNVESGRIRLAEAALEYLGALIEEHPVLLIVDDFDQADEASLAVLHLLMRRQHAGAFMVVLTSRTGSPLKREEVQCYRRDAAALSIHHLEIDPLSDDESEALFDALISESSAKPTTTERRALLSAAAGFPLAIELLFRDWHVNGSRSTALAIRAMTSEVLADPEARYQQLTESLFSDFQATERVVVQVAAVLDRRVSDFDLYKAAGVSHGQVLGALSKMVDRRALREGPGGLEWINPSVRAHAYLQVPSSLRKALHEIVAEELIRQKNAGKPVSRLEIAWHCMRSGRTREASEFLVSGARDAIWNGLPHEAELALSSGLPGIHDDFRDDAALTLGEVLLELNRPKEAFSVLTGLAASNREKALVADFLRLGALQRIRELTDQERDAECSRILHVLNISSPEVAVQALNLGARIIPTFETTPYSDLLLEASYTIESSHLKPPDLITLLAAQGRLHFNKRRTREARTLLKQAFQLSQTHAIRNGVYLYTLNGCGVVANAEGNYKESLSLAVHLYHDSTPSGRDGYATIGASNAAVTSMRLGHYTEAMMWAARAAHLDGPFLPRIWLDQWAWAVSAACLGDQKTARQLAAHLLTLPESIASSSERRAAYSCAADVHRLIGDESRAIEAGAKAVEGWQPDTGSLEIAGRLARWRAATSRTRDAKELAANEFRWWLQQPVDIIDRAELLTALWTVGALTADEAQLLVQLLTTLPKAFTDQMERLSFLEGWKERTGGGGEQIVFQHSGNCKEFNSTFQGTDSPRRRPTKKLP